MGRQALVIIKSGEPFLFALVQNKRAVIGGKASNLGFLRQSGAAQASSPGKQQQSDYERGQTQVGLVKGALAAVNRLVLASKRNFLYELLSVS